MNNNTGGEDNTHSDFENGLGGSGTIKVNMDCTTNYYLKSVAFYARKNGGRWEAVYSKTGGDYMGSVERSFELDVSKEYVEFGFEFDIVWGTNYPYSGVFWTAKQTAVTQPEKIDIELGGTTYGAWIRITVNDVIEAAYETRCKSHTPYGWDHIRFDFDNTDAYNTEGTVLYGRTLSSDRWVKLVDINDRGGSGRKANHLAAGVTQLSKTELVTNRQTGKEEWETTYYHNYDIPREYVEFAFEFSVVIGTVYPYSDVFWTKAQSASERVDTIKVDLYGGVRNVNILIEVNNNEVVRRINCDAGIPKYWKQDDRIRIKTWKTSNYLLNAQRVYGRKSATGAWTVLLNETNGDHETYVNDSEGYVEFGFEFDIVAGREWPYSNVFWTAADSKEEKLDDIYIQMYGTTLNVDLDIYVNGRHRVSLENLPSGYQHYWKASDRIRIKTWKTSNYLLNAQTVYARKAGGAWVRVLHEGNGDHTKYIDNDYVEFGFEFDITAGRDWPYSDVFWTAADSEKEEVEDIYIEMKGTSIYWPALYIDVNGRRVVNEDYLYDGEQHKWN